MGVFVGVFMRVFDSSFLECFFDLGLEWIEFSLLGDLFFFVLKVVGFFRIFYLVLEVIYYELIF